MQTPLPMSLFWQIVVSKIQEESSVSLREYTRLVATYNYYVRNKQYRCREQIEKFKGGPNSEMRIESLKSRNGCNRIAELPRQTVGILEFYNCFCDHVHPSFDNIVFLESQFQKGLLPFQGSITEQPAIWIERFQIIETLRRESEQEANRRAQAQNKGKKVK